MVDSYARWSPRDYLAQYYSTGDVTLDEAAILRFIVDFLLEKKRNFSEMVEVGCGPTIHHVVPFAPYVDRFYMADYLQSNLQEVQEWIAGRGHDWTPYLSGVLASEGNNSKEVLLERVQIIRSKIAGLLLCNVLKARPLGEPKKFPLVSSFYTLECVTQDKDQWRQVIGNVASLVTPAGWFILSSVRNADKYVVCGQEFPTVHVDENNVREALIASGFQPETINVQVHSSGWNEEGFDSIIVCSAQKEGRT